MIVIQLKSSSSDKINQLTESSSSNPLCSISLFGKQLSLYVGSNTLETQISSHGLCHSRTAENEPISVTEIVSGPKASKLKDPSYTLLLQMTTKLTV